MDRELSKLSRLSRQMSIDEKNAHVFAKRLDYLDNEISELRRLVASLDEKLNKLLSVADKSRFNIDRKDLPQKSAVSPTYADSWTTETVRNLVSRQAFFQRTTSVFETYKPTIDALSSAHDCLTTRDVADATGRKRNTESAYLNRLFMAGLLERYRAGNRVYYKLKVKRNDAFEILGGASSAKSGGR